MTPLADTLLALHNRLEGAGIGHAIGGAIALAYHTGEPRATIDIDVNVFVGVSQAGRVLDALKDLVEATQKDRRELERAGQVRLFHDDIPVDLFFATVPFHAAAAARTEEVEFFGRTIPILSATDLAVCKVVFSRDKDWADLRAMAEAGTVDVGELRAWVADILGPDSPNELRAAKLFEEVAAAGTTTREPARLPIRPRKP
ncbi:MAG TPA: DUF6036 family nucleotidyltransferase [Acidimicrobiales bacterium]|nr:DUF6036 family nucleotidyltransferase [Acidimicrobiales bacterium]